MTEKEMHNLLQKIAGSLGMLAGSDVNNIPAIISHLKSEIRGIYALSYKAHRRAADLLDSVELNDN